MSSEIVVDFHPKTGRFVITCPVHRNNMVRMLPNRVWNKGLQAWTAPAIFRNADFIVRYLLGAKITEAALEKIAAIEIARQGPARLKDVPIWYEPKTKPFKHQTEATKQMYNLDYGALFMEMGTGKTKAIIDTFSIFIMEAKVKKILVVCPFSIRTNWKDEIALHCPFNLKVWVQGTPRPKTEVDVMIVGVESLSSSKKAYEQCLEFADADTCMIVDESHTIKNPRAERSKKVVSIGQRAGKRYCLTGTPISHGPLDFYQQFEFLCPDIIGLGSFFAFRNRYAVMGGFEGKQVVSYQNIDELSEIVKPYVFQCTKEQVLDLPTKVYTRRYVSMTPAQGEAYKKMKRERQLLLEQGELNVENVLSQYLALQQITSGFVSMPGEGGQRTEVSLVEPAANPKIKEILAVAEEAAGKQIIVWCKFKREIAQVVEALGSANCSQYHGGLSQEERDESKAKFLSGSTRFFVANMQTGGTGLTLVNANIVVYFSNSFKYTDRVQSEDRCHRIGQRNSCLYIDLVCEKTVDEAVMQALTCKKDLASMIVGNLRSELP